MKNILSITLLCLLVWGTHIPITFAQSSLQNLRSQNFLLSGECLPVSQISQGLIGNSVSRHHSRFLCDSALLSLFHTENRGMVQFVQKNAENAQVLGFSGSVGTGGTLIDVNRVYLPTGQITPPDKGICRFIFSHHSLAGIVCGASIDNGNQRIVPIVAFHVLPSQ
jgi:hypothetical protein